MTGNSSGKTSGNSLTTGILGPGLTYNWFNFTRLVAPLAGTTDSMTYSNSFPLGVVSFMDFSTRLWAPCACLTDPFQE
jgi:hypothetical protein